MDFRGSGEYRNDKSHLKSLLNAARGYIGASRFYSVTKFYRNKPEEYFDRVFKNNKVLPKILKDDSGDQMSPINGRLSGVFLGISLQNGRLPRASPFGDTRVHIPIQAVFNESTNLYFTDFYCISSSYHYVTLVLTKHWSREDNFCKQHLIALDVSDNPFLRIEYDYEGTSYSTIGTPCLMVEVFYTEAIDLQRIQRTNGGVQFSRTGLIGKGTSTWGGLRKNIHCDICNPQVRLECSNHHATFRRNVRQSSPSVVLDVQPEQGSNMFVYVCLCLLIVVVLIDWLNKGRMRFW